MSISRHSMLMFFVSLSIFYLPFSLTLCIFFSSACFLSHSLFIFYSLFLSFFLFLYHFLTSSLFLSYSPSLFLLLHQVRSVAEIEYSILSAATTRLHWVRRKSTHMAINAIIVCCIAYPPSA